MPHKPILAVGIDPGGARTRCVICVVEDLHLRYLGHADAESRGWVKSRIADQQSISETVLEVVREAERLAEVTVESAVVGIGGITVRGAVSRAGIDLNRPREIQQRDVNRAIDRAANVPLKEDRMVLGLFPQDFIVDNYPGHRDPRKMLGQRLDANALLITGSIQEHNCLIGAINQAHLEVEETVFDPIAAHFAAVLPEERRQGMALVDIGAQSTNVVVFYDESLQLASSLQVSADHFTRDVALGFRINYEDALVAKEEYGCAVSAFTAANSVIEVESGPDREARDLPRRVLNEIIEARARELFEFVRRELQRVGMEQSLVGGVVLTGGGARLNAMCDVAENVLRCQARIGLPAGIQDWPEELMDPSWTVAAGLSMYSARLKVQGELERQSVGLLARILR
jgi:cell division protein FtsA